MYKVNLMSGSSVVSHCIFDEYPTERNLEELVGGKEDHWIDIERIPTDVDEYQRERVYEFSE